MLKLMCLQINQLNARILIENARKCLAEPVNIMISLDIMAYPDFNVH